MAGGSFPRQSVSQSCPMCGGMGCVECGHTGSRWDATGTTESGATFRAHGSGEMSPEDMEMLKPLVDAALAQMPRGRNTNPMGNGGPCMSCGGNDGYGPAPHHTPDCYFASDEDAGEMP